MRFRLLGPLEVRSDDGTPVEVGGAKPRALLTLPDVIPLDWTTDSLLAVRAWGALALDGDLAAAHASLLPYRGRQIVVGTAGASWGPYDPLLNELAARMPRGRPVPPL
ncbi:hypothetical protein ACQPZJ_23970 [Actinoplanes sp. CA-054009]